MSMSCETIRGAISAELDGEDPGVDRSTIESHVSACPDCRVFTLSAAEVRRRSQFEVAAEMPDLADQVVRRTVARDRSAAGWFPRVALAVIAVQIVALSLPELFASGHDAHSARHLGAFTLSYAVGLFVVVARPARARTMLPVSIVLAGAMAVTAALDVAEGRVPLIDESLHLPELFSVLFLWLLTRTRVAAASEPSVPTLPGWIEELGSDTDDEHRAEVRPLRRRAGGR
jgi:predicted anti-sigma-YlaC factor YlaD